MSVTGAVSDLVIFENCEHVWVASTTWFSLAVG